jgi:hypothetical protein
MTTTIEKNEKDFFRNQIADLVRDKHELLDALVASNKLIQEAADYYESTWTVDKVSDRIIKQALSNQSLILKHKI